MSKKFGVVILNYLAWKETIECVKCFLRYRNERDVMIAVVDNGSNNDSVSKLNSAFIGDEHVLIVSLAKNTGFANGNNYGYQLLKDRGCDYFIFSNSDILFQDDIYSWIENISETTQFDVLGPDIYASKMSVHQNPLKTYTENWFLIKAKMISKHLERIYCLTMAHLSSNKNQVRYAPKTVSVYQNEKIEGTKTNVTLHGSFLIASKHYFDEYQEMFDPRTFLYMEEHILYQRCKRKSLHMVYNGEMQVNHLQGVSTEQIDSSYFKRRAFRMKCEINSLKIYKCVLKEKV